MKKTNSILLLFVLCLSITDVCAQKVIVTNDTFRMKCLKELIREAQKGDAEALYLVGRHCIAGEAIYEDEDLGISYIYKSAGQNYAPALYYIACQLHDTGDTESSIRYYKETLLHYEQSDSAHVSLECVCTEIWDIAVSLCSGTVEEYLDIVYNMTPEALELFIFLSNHDNDALSLLITYYLRKKNYEKHLEYAMKAYERGMVSRAGFTLGEIYYYGLGVDKDLSKAIAYYEYGAKEGNNYVCRQRLSDIFYEEKMVDKMFQYSYDYAHGDRISHDSSSGNVLQRLQACYRFGRGTDRNETLAKLWTAVSAWYYEGESIVEFESDINVENPKELETYIYSIILKELEKNNINEYACVYLLKGLYMLNVAPSDVAVRKLLVDAYNMEDVSRTDRILIGYLLHIYSFSSTEVREIMKSFEEKVGITLNELKEEDNDEIDNCIYRLWVECISLIEKKQDSTAFVDNFVQNKYSSDIHLLQTSTKQPVSEESLAINKTVYTVNGVSFSMVKVYGGTFTMGASYGNSDAEPSEKPAHQVALGDYSIGETEVTQALWQAVMGKNPSFTTGDLQCPVEMVSWKDCQKFIRKLYALTGVAFRLPTEAEWEYAARGGSQSRGYKYSGSNDIESVAWYGDNSLHGTSPVKSKKPNELGLYDMSGNVGEWCTDWYGQSYYSSSPQINPKGPSSGLGRSFRGGSWDRAAWCCRTVSRDYNSPDFRGFYTGLRLAQ